MVFQNAPTMSLLQVVFSQQSTMCFLVTMRHNKFSYLHLFGLMVHSIPTENLLRHISPFLKKCSSLKDCRIGKTTLRAVHEVKKTGGKSSIGRVSS